MARICPLFSGSTGNSTYISGREGSFLVDAGASFKGIKDALELAGGSIEEISAVFITHTHSDHIKGIKPLLNKLKVPLIAHEKTIETLINAEKIPAGTALFPIADSLSILGAEVTRFDTSHDAEGSSGYSFVLDEGIKLSVCTDLGVVTDTVRKTLAGSNAILLESNHDIEMLKKGPYPPELKVRIMSDKGHISNNASASELSGFLNSGTSRFILGHLSQHNNTPLLALSAAESALMDLGAKNGRDYALSVAAPKGNRVIVV